MDTAIVRCCRCQASLDAMVAQLRTWRDLVACGACGTRQGVREVTWRRVGMMQQPGLPGVR